jgi:BCD family chlorophyll transporter-like MFS transporter
MSVEWPPSSPAAPNFGWLSIARLGLVQMALGAIVVLTTSTINRVMVVELALPALLPGLLVGLHYAMQGLRPRMGHGSDVGGRRTPWILGGMTVLAAGGLGAAGATALLELSTLAGTVAAALAFATIGIGVSACGTNLLVLLAKRVAAPRRAAAATTVWLMMIFGFALTAGLAGQLLDPYTPTRLIAVTGAVSLIAVALTVIALWRLEGQGERRQASADRAGASPQRLDASLMPGSPGSSAFRVALKQVWSEPAARQFTVFVFVSMLAYSAQDLILEPFAGTVFGYTPGQSTQLAGIQHGGAFAGMLLAALAGSRIAGRQLGSLRGWTIGGCIASAIALAGLVIGGLVGDGTHTAWPLQANVFLLGLSNGAFAIAAIASMMRLASEGRAHREGVRMGLWGAAQAIAFGAGGLIGAVASDLARWLLGQPGLAYATVFALEALLFLAAARLAARIGQSQTGEFRIDADADAPATADRVAADRAAADVTPSGAPG